MQVSEIEAILLEALPLSEVHVKGTAVTTK